MASAHFMFACNGRWMSTATGEADVARNDFSKQGADLDVGVVTPGIETGRLERCPTSRATSKLAEA